MTHKDRIGLTPVKTLARLAVEGTFVSVDLNLPDHVHTMNPGITLDGEPFKRFCAEVYAPGDESGYALVFPEDRNAGIELVKGNFGLNWTEYED